MFHKTGHQADYLLGACCQFFSIGMRGGNNPKAVRYAGKMRTSGIFRMKRPINGTREG